MFATSSQLKHWMFNNEAEVQSLRQEANERYVELHGSKMSVSWYPPPPFHYPVLIWKWMKMVGVASFCAKILFRALFITKVTFHDLFIHFLQEEQRRAYFLTASEERHLCRHFEFVLKEFCSRFQPPMPKYVLVRP